MNIFDENSFSLNPQLIIHSDADQNVYKVKYHDQDLTVKEMNITREVNLNHYLEEVYILGELNHISICPILGAYLNNSTSHFYIVRKYYEQTLLKEIKTKRDQNLHWTSGELYRIFRNLIIGFEYIQSHGIVHCNISPKIILKDRDMYLIAGFDYSYKKNPKPRSSLKKNYLSPIIANNIVTYMRKPEKITHNAFKSDVFSLGLTFLHMAYLSKISNLETLTKADLEAEINRRIESIKDPGGNNKSLLRRMLCLGENNRPDFKILKNEFCNSYIHRAPFLPQTPINIFIPDAPDGPDAPEDITVCRYCQNLEENSSNNFIFIDNILYHAECYDSCLNFEIKLSSIDQINNTVSQVNQLVVCKDCGLITHMKFGINENVCLRCLGGVAYSNISNEYEQYRNISGYSIENYKSKTCQKCYKFAEILFLNCHYFCYNCLNEFFGKNSAQRITCYWGCCRIN